MAFWLRCKNSKSTGKNTKQHTHKTSNKRLTIEPRKSHFLPFFPQNSPLFGVLSAIYINDHLFRPNTLLKAHKKSIRRATVNTFGYIAKAIGPHDVLATLLNNLKVQERQLRVCTTIAIAIVAETCSPFTVSEISIFS